MEEQPKDMQDHIAFLLMVKGLAQMFNEAHGNILGPILNSWETLTPVHQEFIRRHVISEVISGVIHPINQPSEIVREVIHPLSQPSWLVNGIINPLNQSSAMQALNENIRKMNENQARLEEAVKIMNEIQVYKSIDRSDE